jgi:hypothetical protein
MKGVHEMLLRLWEFLLSRKLQYQKILQSIILFKSYVLKL